MTATTSTRRRSSRKPLPPAVPVWQKWNTLQVLWASLYLIWAMDALLLVATIIGGQVHRDAMKGVGRDTVPSIIHAQHIKTALADMDANIANELLGKPKEMEQDAKAYDAKRKEAATSLIEAAKNITFDEAEQKPIEAIQVGLGTYEGQVQRARDLHEDGEPTFVAAYHEAAKMMDEQLLPQADVLDRVNHDELEKVYNGLSRRSIGSVFLLLVAGAALLGALFGVQRYLNQKTHRLLNPLLVAATIFTVWFISNTFVTFSAERNDLKIAREDAFISIHALLQAKATAYAANADESRYLLDAAHAGAHESAFLAKIDMLVKTPGGLTFEEAARNAKRGRVRGLTGFLADELNNITFGEDERTRAVQTLIEFSQYYKVDREIRRLQESGKHAEAVQLCIGRSATDSNSEFDQFDKALDATVEVNQTEFDKAVEAGFKTLSYFELKASIIALLIATLVFFGLLQRIREYQ